MPLAAPMGEGQVVLVAGDPGLGKSRLTRELLRAARRLGCLVPAGQGSRLEMGLPYALWADAVHPYLRGLPEAAAAALAGVLPLESLPGQALPPVDLQGADRRRVLEAVFQFLRRPGGPPRRGGGAPGLCRHGGRTAAQRAPGRPRTGAAGHPGELHCAGAHRQPQLAQMAASHAEYAGGGANGHRDVAVAGAVDGGFTST